MSLSRRLILQASLIIGSAALCPTIALGKGGDDPSREVDMRLLEDAATAWKFFRQPGELAPAILPATAWMEEGGGIGQHPVLTMWDVGSLILAYVSARYLGLMDEAEFDTRIRGVLAFLEKSTFSHDGKRLLNYRNSTKDASSVERGFDSTDTGRLLIALKALDEFTLGTFAISEIVAGWNIKSTIRDGKMYDIKESAFEPAESFLYANYVSRGYDLWGIKHDPVLDDSYPLRNETARTRFLQAISKTGAIATEPSVSEALELGVSEPAQVIADVLFAAQMGRYDQTGELTSVSEGPMDREPWFTYQGYRLDGQDGTWTVYSVEPGPQWQTNEFAEMARMISAKAAYLWLAFRPEPYSETLVDFIRENAKSDQLGFSAGIYEKSKQTANVYDINTNAAILEAIAFVKNGRKPLINAAAQYLVDAALSGNKKARDALLSDDLNLHWSVDTRKALQQILAQHGTSPGVADGNIGPRTRRALRQLLVH